VGDGDQKYSRDRVATAATKADACHQEYVSEESHQDRDHGEVVVRSRKPGVSFECATAAPRTVSTRTVP